jgi:hypothetical protein
VLAVAPPQRKARYTLSMSRPLYLIVSERHGVVVGIEAFSDQPLTGEVPDVAPDPSGVVLGATEAAVLQAHPDAQRTVSADEPTLVVLMGPRYVAAYAFAGGRVRAIIWFARPNTDPPGDGPALTEPTGDGPATAVRVIAKTEDDGITWEGIWALFHPCNGTTRWRKTQVATSRSDGRIYDAIRYSCPTTGATRTVYFDITAFFGKF